MSENTKHDEKTVDPSEQADDVVSPPLVVGIGASAGGLDALKRFFNKVQEDSNLCYIVVQHLDPNHKSMLASILDRETRVDVKEAKDGADILANTAYIIPPGCFIEVVDDHIKLTQQKERFGARTAIDHLLRSLAEVKGASAVGILFSGAGSDGTAGMRRLKAEGGLTIVQEPSSAEYEAMLRSAINAGVVDKVVEVEKIPQIVTDYASNLHLGLSAETKQKTDVLRDITTLFKTRENFDLTQYKDNTVERRICRRLSLTGNDDLVPYAKLLRGSESERRHLMRDLMINVTDFFRDREAFETLKDEVIPKIVSNATDDIRVWVAGCASGEEAYSIAILFLEQIGARNSGLDLKIFATDVDEDAVRTARKGIYPQSVLSELPSQYLSAYFNKLDDHHYQVSGFLRDRISFATQNVYSDPPFSRMDLVSCRNLLIYLKKNVQEQVLKSFYFALKPSGYLFLGSSENLANQKQLFKPVSQKWRIFQRTKNLAVRAGLQTYPGFMPSGFKDDGVVTRRSRKEQVPQPGELARRALVSILPPSVLIDGDNQVLYLHGDLQSYLRLPQGELNREFLEMLGPDLKSRLRSGLFKARSSLRKVVVRSPQFLNDSELSNIEIEVTIQPVTQDEFNSENALILTFEEKETSETPLAAKPELSGQSDDEKYIVTLERELKETREELQSTVEELETSTEELKASHEEALSTNEELQSTNEELEASTEELRSLNEELTTVNSQLKEKIQELQTAHSDLENFFASTNLATVFLDARLTLKRATPSAMRLLRLGMQDMARPVREIVRPMLDNSLLNDSRQVLENLKADEQEVATDDGKFYTRKILPYISGDRRIDGVVVSFIDITELKKATQHLEARGRQQAVVAKLGIEALSSKNIQALMSQAIREVVHTLDVDFGKILEYRPESDSFILQAGVGWDDVQPGYRVPAGINSQSGYALKQHEPIFVQDLAREKRFNSAELLSSHGATSGVSCIIANGDQPYGVLSVHTREKRVFTQEDANFLNSVANLLTVAVHRQQAEEELRESQERLELARQAAHLGIHDHDLVNDCIHWDSCVRQIFGLPEGDDPVPFSTFVDGLHPQDKEATIRALDEHLAERGQYLRTEYRVVNREDRKVRWVEATGKTFFDELGTPCRVVGTMQDITERKETELELFKSEQQLRIAKNSNRVGTFTYPLDGGPDEWDSFVRSVWGLQKNERPHYDRFMEGVHPDDRETVEAAIAKAADPSKEGHYHCVYRVINRITGELSWVEATGQMTFDRQKPVKLIGMVIDITDRMKLEQSLKSAVAKLELENRKKNEFLATLGHELRNPLAAVNSGIQLLQLQSDESEWALQMMDKNVGLMSNLLSDLLDITRISLGKIELDKQKLNLNDVLEETLELLQFRKGETPVKLDWVLANEALFVMGDKTRLEQVFFNLINNALKFTPHDGHIQIALSREDESALFSVKDTGVGIPKALQENIFNPFEQVLGARHNNTGLGIGLSLVKQFTELHGGTVAVESEGEGQGTTFTVTLPLAGESEMLPSADVSTAMQNSPEPGLKVMLVDDNEDACKGMQAMLENVGCEVAVAHSSKECMQALTYFRPDAFILDIGLPDGSGHELVSRIKSVYGAPAIYVALTGYSHKEAVAASKAAGFNCHLSKPALFSDLLAAISRKADE